MGLTEQGNCPSRVAVERGYQLRLKVFARLEMQHECRPISDENWWKRGEHTVETPADWWLLGDKTIRVLCYASRLRDANPFAVTWIETLVRYREQRLHQGQPE